jgi:hypothetical protein
MLAEQLKHLNAVNIGTAGTFVIRRPVKRTQLRAELSLQLPFEAEIMFATAARLSGCCLRITSRTSPCNPTSSAW